MRQLIATVLACVLAPSFLLQGISAQEVSAQGVSTSTLNLQTIDATGWSDLHAAHLLSRAGFGGTPEQIRALASLSPQNAVDLMVYGSKRRNNSVEFVHSGVFDAGLDPFPASRPATTRLAKQHGEALGIKVKPGGNRPLQPVVNKFFYWLRASRLETDRVAYWWANRMLSSDHPLQEKMALFWHGHFATNEDKVRDYRKMLKQLQLFRSQGLGSFRDLLIGVAQDPAMLVFLDAGVNVKGSPNENFAREIMEIFSMGVGNYSEQDVQEAARAFTGWNVDGLEFVVNADQHDDQTKQFLGQSGNFDGVQIIDQILAESITAQYIASKVYRFFVNNQLTDQQSQQLGDVFRELDYDIAAFMQQLLLSEDFYQPQNMGSRIKGPVELLISTYKRMGLQRIPGVPDFNVVTGALGQRLMHPPTVAGWSHGRSWITPSLMFERSNFVLDVVFPDIGFVPPDRYPSYTAEIVKVQNRLRQGKTVSAATKPTGVEGDAADMSASNLLADADEAFNTRLGSMRGWQMALERVKPIDRQPALLQLRHSVMALELATPRQVIDHWEQTYFSVTLDEQVKQTLAATLSRALGTDDIIAAVSYMEEPLRIVLHQMLSLPEFQLS